MRTVEVVAKSERRRRFSPEEKSKLVAEALETSVSSAARRHGISPSVIFLWKKQLKSSGRLSNVVTHSALPTASTSCSPFVRMTTESTDFTEQEDRSQPFSE